MSACGVCGGGMQIYSRSHGRKRAFYYGCPRYRVDRCTNALEVRMEIADEAALGIVADDVLSPDVISLALDKLTKKFAAPDEAPEKKRARLTAALRKIAKELTNLQDAVASGNGSETVLSGIRERERRQRELQAELSAVDAGPAVVAAADSLRRDALTLLDDWTGLLGQQVGTSRQLLRKLLGQERFVFHPRARGSSQWYGVGVKPTLDRFLEGLPVLKKLVRPQRETRACALLLTYGSLARPERSWLLRRV